jgi:hypothetical protein
MSDFDARHLDDPEGLAGLAELLHPTKAARSEAKARGRRRLREGFTGAAKAAAKTGGLTVLTTPAA